MVPKDQLLPEEFQNKQGNNATLLIIEYWQKL